MKISQKIGSYIKREHEKKVTAVKKTKLRLAVEKATEALEAAKKGEEKTEEKEGTAVVVLRGGAAAPKKIPKSKKRTLPDSETAENEPKKRMAQK